jgi:hypothetical protein
LWFEASLGKSFIKPNLEKTLYKNRAGGMAQGEGPELKPQYHTHTHTKTTPPPKKMPEVWVKW